MHTDEAQIKPAGSDFLFQPARQQLVGAAFEVHNILGFGLLGKIYRRALQVEWQLRRIKVELAPKLQVQFKGVVAGDFAPDLLVAGEIIVELKTDAKYQSVHEARSFNELHGMRIHPGYLIKFGRERVKHKRMFF